MDREIAMLNDLITVINRYPLAQGERDIWRWNPSPDGLYSTKMAYEELWLRQEGVRTDDNEAFKLLWNKISPPKVIVHAWRVMHGKISTRNNLQRRHVIPALADSRCVL